MALQSCCHLEQLVIIKRAADQRISADERTYNSRCAAAKSPCQRNVTVHGDRQFRYGYTRFLKYELSYLIDQIRLILRQTLHLLAIELEGGLLGYT
ncbi:hypothetical protein D3C78_1272900 [compost metagenome]